MEEAIQARQAMETLNVQLRESEERYRTLFDSAPMAVFVCDRNAVILQYNHRAVELWGREPTCGVEKYCGSTRLWLPDGTLLPHDQSPVLDVLRTGVPAHNVEVFIERPDGSRLLVLVNFAAIKNARGEVTGAITSFIDITERKRAEEELRQAEKRLRFVMDSMPQNPTAMWTTSTRSGRSSPACRSSRFAIGAGRSSSTPTTWPRTSASGSTPSIPASRSISWLVSDVRMASTAGI
jgi:PAS domain S-box-containing protein